jgi:beta-lactamase regulating signal transducer with metallopeptidase domain
MNKILVILAETALVLALYYIAYVLFLRNEKNFVRNRFYLLFALLFSVIYPFIKIKLVIPSATVLQTNITTLVLPEIIASPYNTETSVSFSIFDVLQNIYFVGIGIFAILFFVKVFNILRLIIFSKKEKQNGIFIIKTKKNYAPFSFFNFVVIPENQYNKSDEATIILHERKHIAEFHSLDLIFYEIIKIFQWFNPFIWLYNRELRSIHEYIADEAVIKNGMAKNDYFSLLLFNQVGCRTSKIGNNFNIILIKKRIKMLMKTNSKKGKMLRLLPAMLVTAVLLMSQISCVQKPAESVEIADVEEIATQNVEELQHVIIRNDTIPANAVFVVEGKVFDGAEVKNIDMDNVGTIVRFMSSGVSPEYVEIYGEKAQNGITFFQMKQTTPKNETFEEAQSYPEFIGGEDAFREFLRNNISTPKDVVRAKVNIKLYYSFVVEKDGSVRDIECISSNTGKSVEYMLPTQLCQTEAIRAIALTSGKWKPAVNKNGEDITQRLVLPFEFNWR